MKRKRNLHLIAVAFSRRERNVVAFETERVMILMLAMRAMYGMIDRFGDALESRTKARWPPSTPASPTVRPTSGASA